MTWVTEQAALIWLGAALILGVVEVLTLDFFFIMLAGGALAGALSSWAGAGWPVSTLVAVAVALLLVLAIRPFLLRRLQATPHRPTGAAALVGQTAEVTETVSARDGLVKLAGEAWTSRTEDETPLPVGALAYVVRIEGATAVVSAARPVSGS